MRRSKQMENQRGNCMNVPDREIRSSTLSIRPIGVILTQFSTNRGVPIQSAMSDETGVAVVEDRYAEGLDSLEQFSHAILLYWFHQARKYALRVTPYLDNRPRGVFATRAPARPNPIGLSIVRIERIEGNRIYFRGADMVNGTPLIDIKPFVPEFDNRPDAVSGWLERPLSEREDIVRADGRFQRTP